MTGGAAFQEEIMSGITGMPVMAASMMASIEAIKAAAKMMQASTEILAAGTANGNRAALPYTQLVDKLA